ncbi:von Willebrand factor D and EGF domain-containing protein isoform X1 [Paramormyrops kingsleyae]|nr:von Willebrand factor D and EGF domain-containing protein-like isoform X1 [Paramormyrops kingsleyae]
MEVLPHPSPHIKQAPFFFTRATWIVLHPIQSTDMSRVTSRGCSRMGLLCCSPSLVKTMLAVASLILLAKLGEGRSDASRGVAVPFVFDPKATCQPACKHAGICIRNNTCFCSKGYEGELCQYAACDPKCKNGGECLRPGKCRCPPGFGGKYCHQVVCDGGCWNGGECIAENRVVKCLCPSSWTGSRCEEAICPQGCQNGGSCVAPGICSCPEGWLGGACHVAVCKRPCVNGGKCISPNVCRCRIPFSGPQCEVRKMF